MLSSAIFSLRIVSVSNFAKLCFSAYFKYRCRFRFIYNMDIPLFTLISSILNSFFVFSISQGKQGNKINNPFCLSTLINSYSDVLMTSKVSFFGRIFLFWPLQATINTSKMMIYFKFSLLFSLKSLIYKIKNCSCESCKN